MTCDSNFSQMASFTKWSKNYFVCFTLVSRTRTFLSKYQVVPDLNYLETSAHIYIYIYSHYDSTGHYYLVCVSWFFYKRLLHKSELKIIMRFLFPSYEKQHQTIQPCHGQEDMNRHDHPERKEDSHLPPFGVVPHIFDITYPRLLEATPSTTK